MAPDSGQDDRDGRANCAAGSLTPGGRPFRSASTPLRADGGTIADGEAEGLHEESGGQHHGETASARSRFWLTNDLIAFGLVGAYVVTIWAAGAGWLDPAVLSGQTGSALIAFVGTSVAWAFGADAVKAWRGGGSEGGSESGPSRLTEQQRREVRREVERATADYARRLSETRPGPTARSGETQRGESSGDSEKPSS